MQCRAVEIDWVKLRTDRHMCLRRAQLSGTTGKHPCRMLKNTGLFVGGLSDSDIQPNERDEPNKPNNDLYTLAGFFSILLTPLLG